MNKAKLKDILRDIENDADSKDKLDRYLVQVLVAITEEPDDGKDRKGK